MAGLFRKFDDASAPILSGNSAGSLILVLKAVLVDGYGTTDPLGWEVAFEDAVNNVCVFRPLVGTFKPFVRVDDNISSTGVQHAEIICYESMSDVNTGFFPCPNLATTPDHSIIKSFSNTSVSVPWYIIGDDRGFWFMTRPYDQTGNGTGTTGGDVFFAMAYIGDFPCNVLSNTYNWMTILNDASTTDTNMYIGSTAIDKTKTSLFRNPETLESGAVNPDELYTTARFSTFRYGLGTYSPNSSPRNEQYFYEPVIPKYNESLTIGDIPGLYNMLWQSPTWEGTAYYYRQEPEELVPFFDGDMFVFPPLSSSASWNTLQNSVTHRASILTGDGFRNAN